MKLKEKKNLKFTCTAKVLKNPEEQDKYITAASSLGYLKSIIPDDINLENNKDICILAGNLCVINYGDKNHNLTGSKQAIDLAKTFKFKMLDVEHNRNKIIGCIVNTGFYSLEGEELSEDEIKEKEDPYYLSIAAVVYKKAYPGLAEQLEEYSDPLGDEFVSLSWEVDVGEFFILKGSRYLKEGELITADEEVEKLTPYIRAFGGSGKAEDGDPIYLFASGGLTGLGVGVVGSPAASVSGILIVASEEKKELQTEEEPQEENSEQSTLLEAVDKTNDPILPDSTSQNLNTNVTNNMKIKVIKTREEITDENLINIEASAINNFIETEIAQVSEKFVKEREQKEQAITAAETKAQELEAKVKEAAEKTEKLEKELNEIKAAQVAREAEDLFNARMSSLDEEYELEKEEREIIARTIRKFDSESYEVWANDFAILNRGKKKPVKKEIKASEEVAAAEVLDKAKVENTVVNTSTFSEEKNSKFKNAFSIENCEIAKPRK